MDFKEIVLEQAEKNQLSRPDDDTFISLRAIVSQTCSIFAGSELMESSIASNYLSVELEFCFFSNPFLSSVDDTYD